MAVFRRLAPLVLLCTASCEKLYAEMDENGVEPTTVKMFAEMTELGQEMYADDVYEKQLLSDVQKISDDLEAYIQDWHAGNAPAEIPDELKPDGMKNGLLDFKTLVKVEDIPREDGYEREAVEQYGEGEEEWDEFLPPPMGQWGGRPRRLNKPDQSVPDKIYGNSWTPDTSYGITPLWAPLGTTLHIDGQYPHSRFMNIQLPGPFDFHGPALAGTFGAAEVAIVDVDIEPNEGSENPFLPGADRNAENRDFHVEILLDKGNAVELNPPGSMVAPHYRQTGGRKNYRVGGGMQSMGTFGEMIGQQSEDVDVRVIPSLLWYRVYLPDLDQGALGGVPLPKLTYELETGEKYWLVAEGEGLGSFMNFPYHEKPHPYEEALDHDDHGWQKLIGIQAPMTDRYFEGNILNASVENRFTPTAAESLLVDVVKAGIRDSDRSVWRRGADMPPPANYEASASCVNYYSLFTHGENLDDGEVLVVSGKMPTTPETWHGNDTMETAQARYFSFNHYVVVEDITDIGTFFGTGTANPSPMLVAWDPSGYPDAPAPDLQNDYHATLSYGVLNDEHIVKDDGNNYIVAYSRKADRPTNATTDNGITWQDWGDHANQGLVLRWMSVYPDWYFDKTPDEERIPVNKARWVHPDYDHELLGLKHKGWLEEYHPVISVMTTDEFEELQAGLTARDLRVRAYELAGEELEDDEVPATDGEELSAQSGAGCGCSLAGGNTRPSTLVMLLALGLVLGRVRRR